MTETRSFGSAVGPVRLALAALVLLTWPQAPARGQSVAITGGRVFPVSGPSSDNATVLIRDGRIAAVGPDVEIPADARRVDARGKWVTPGLFNAHTHLGLTEISAVSGTNEDEREDSDISAAFDVLEGINPASQLIPVTRVEGITTVLSAPDGGLVAGRAAVLDLVGVTVTEMAVRAPAAMIGALNEDAKDAGGGSRAGTIGRLRRVFEDALDYDRRREDFRHDRMQELAAPAPDLEALLPVVRGELPMVIEANRRSDIETALRLAADFDLDLILLGAEEGWQVADQLAAAGVPVIIDPMFNIPSYNAPSPRLDNAAILSAAGVSVLMMGSGTHNARNVRQAAGKAIAYGMNWDLALRAVTLAPAMALGLDDYGALAPGKVANVVIWSGDPFELSTAAETVIIRGREIPMTSRQRELLERYRNLPPSFFSER